MSLTIQMGGIPTDQTRSIPRVAFQPVRRPCASGVPTADQRARESLSSCENCPAQTSFMPRNATVEQQARRAPVWVFARQGLLCLPSRCSVDRSPVESGPDDGLRGVVAHVMPRSHVFIWGLVRSTPTREPPAEVER